MFQYNYKMPPRVIRYVAAQIGATRDRMVRELLAVADVQTCDDGEELMILAANVAIVDQEWLCEQIVRGERATCDESRPLDIWDGRNDDVREFVNGYYIVS